jgi:nucleotidyltransferase substrate binding protein (TIGR01987 family)
MLDALIQRYEFTHELAWKLMKDYLEFMGISGIIGSRDAIRYALQNGIIEDDRWMDTIVDRNITSHNYNQEIAIEVAGRIISVYHSLFNEFLRVMTEKESLL